MNEKLTKEQRARLIRLALDKDCPMTVSQLARRFSVGTATINRVLDAHGIDRDRIAKWGAHG